MQSIADAALTGARGNSGIIFAQFFAGLSEVIKDTETVSSDVFVEAAKNAEKRAREAILAPVEGTILTVMKEWVRLLEESKHLRDIGLIFKNTLKGTKQSVEDTPKLLPS
jgi:dihydroxyacetone kinase-like predicted kinase